MKRWNPAAALVAAVVMSSVLGPASRASAGDVLVIAAPEVHARLGLALELELSALGHRVRWDAPLAEPNGEAQIADAWARTVSSGADAAVLLEARGAMGTPEHVMGVHVALPSRPSGAVSATVSGIAPDDGGRAVALVAATLLDDALRSEATRATTVRVPTSSDGTLRIEIAVVDGRAQEEASSETPAESAPPRRRSVRFTGFALGGAAYSVVDDRGAYDFRSGMALQIEETFRIELSGGMHGFLDEQGGQHASAQLGLGGRVDLGDQWALTALGFGGYGFQTDVSRHAVVLGASLELSRNMRGPNLLTRAGIDVFVTPEGTVTPTLTIGAGMHFE